MMKRLFIHIANRIASFYKHIGLSHDYVAQGYFLLSFSLTCYLLTIAHAILFQLDSELPKPIIILILIPLIIETARFEDVFPNAQVEFQRFEKNNKKQLQIIELLFFLFLVVSLAGCVFILLYLK